MANNKIIIVGLIIVIIALLAVLGFMMQSPTKEATKLTITSNSTLYEGDSLSFKLTDLNKTPIENEFLHIIICKSSGKVVMNETVKTNSKGNGELELNLTEGKYEVNITFEGNDNYTGNSTVQKLKINEKVVESEPVSSTQYSSSSYSSSSGSSSSSSSSDSYGPAVDSDGITREEAKKYGYKYTTSHGGHYIGSNDHWDENAGVYHD